MNSSVTTLSPKSPWVRRASLTFVAISLLSACASQSENRHHPTLESAMVADVRPNQNVGSCRDSLSRPTTGRSDNLDPGNIRLVNWNARKMNSPGWNRELDALASGKDLVLIQEASLRAETTSKIPVRRYRSFAPGYRRAGEITGLLTLSKIKPVTHCRFVSMEPVLRTPKATSITQYGLNGTDVTLVVVNLHAVNFSFGLAAFREQFEVIAEALSRHRGPVILAGDFNTWRAARMEVVEQLARRLNLQPLQFEQDHRVRFLGQPLDHIYIRGLSSLATSTARNSTSDHNPMSATHSM
jgi:endonuclease/exonuclease/phosphatase (EEP) superfamily protein YafD